MTQDLTIRQTQVGMVIQPEETIETARRAAKALQSVVAQKPKPVIMNGEQYLEFDDLQLLGQFYRYTVKTGQAEPIEVDGVKGAKARAELIDMNTGEVIGGAEAYCMRDEDHWNTRAKYEWQGQGSARHRVKISDEPVPWFQLASMAQTRAGAKALRNRLAWVVVLAGYKSTPAEEMTDGTVSEAVQERRTVETEEHWCKEHNTAFFKKGAMKGYAHKLADGGWHNEPEPDAPPAPPVVKTSQQLPDAPPIVVNPPETPVQLITQEERDNLLATMKTYEMDIKALGKWMLEHDIPKPPSMSAMPKSVYDKIMAALEMK